ncbi:MAG TPA: type I methionyl aminopeptidase [Lacipirellulaceae bacterium]|nr:type I methionyl aminopeptidase [Lacipirellulaceae bacterium]
MAGLCVTSHRTFVVIQLKSEREIALMRQAGICVWQAHQLVRQVIAPGITTADIDAVIAEHFRQCGAEPLFKDYPHQNAGRPAFPAATCTSVNEEVVHGIPTHRILREGDIVSVDTGCRLNGWCGDAAVTYPIARIAPAIQRLLDVTVRTLELAFELMHTKTRWSQIAREMAQFVRDNGFSTVECFVGHGIGREMHEEPQVPNFLSRSLRGSGDFRIEPGLVIAVEPMVNMGTKRVKMHRDHWTQSTLDRKHSAHFEHTIAVTNDGPVLLTDAPTPDEIANLPWDFTAAESATKAAVSSG